MPDPDSDPGDKIVLRDVVASRDKYIFSRR